MLMGKISCSRAATPVPSTPFSIPEWSRSAGELWTSSLLRRPLVPIVPFCKPSVVLSGLLSRSWSLGKSPSRDTCQQRWWHALPLSQDRRDDSVVEWLWLGIRGQGRRLLSHGWRYGSGVVRGKVNGWLFGQFAMLMSIVIRRFIRMLRVIVVVTSEDFFDLFSEAAHGDDGIFAVLYLLSWCPWQDGLGKNDVREEVEDNTARFKVTHHSFKLLVHCIPPLHSP